MKTNNNIRLASISFLSAAFLFAAVSNSSAKSTRYEMKEREAATATYRLDNLNSSIESSIRFVAAEVNPGEDLLNFETEAAFDRMDELTQDIEQSIRFNAPAVNAKDEAEALEVNQAVERLDELTRKIEYSIYFQAPAAE